MPPDSVLLLRLLWNPDDVDGSTVKPSAFPAGQLDGKSDAYVSVHRADISVRSAMEATATKQQAKANGDTMKRYSPMIGSMICGEVRGIMHEGAKALNVKPYPEPDNDAHCGVENVIGKLGRGSVDKIRQKLASLSSPARTFDEIYGAK